MAACIISSIVASTVIVFQICMFGMTCCLEIYAQSVNVRMEDCMLGTVVLVAACEISNILHVRFRSLFTMPRTMKAMADTFLAVGSLPTPVVLVSVPARSPSTISDEPRPLTSNGFQLEDQNNW